MKGRAAQPASPGGTTGRLLVLCILVGTVAGLGAIAFYWLLEISSHFFLDQLAGYRPEGPAGEAPLLPESDTPFRPWVLLILPAIGGCSEGDPDDAAMKERRETPPPRAAPGSGIGLSAEGGKESEDPPADDD